MKKLKTITLLFVLSCITSVGFSQKADSLWFKDNPFKDSTTIYFYVPKADTVSLTVFNRWGQVVNAFYKNTYLQGGTYSSSFGDTVKDAMYIVVLKINAKKIIDRIFKSSTASAIQSTNVDNNHLLLSPNPTGDLLNIPIDGVKLVTVYNLQGQIVKSVRLEINILSLADLKADQYIVSVYTDKRELITTSKIIKID